MKIAIHMFTIYMLTLSLVPCGDENGGIIEIANHILGIEHIHVSDHDQHSSGCGDDTCSPFCACSCCSIPIDIPVKLPVLKEYLLLMSTDKPLFYSDFIPSSFIHSIWHPPIYS